MKKAKKKKPAKKAVRKAKPKAKAKARKKADPPMLGMLAPTSRTIDVPDELEVKCPMCLTHWANAHIQFGQKIAEEHFAIREDLVDQVSFQKNGLPVCPVCGFQYTPNSIYGLMMAASTRASLERKLWNSPKGMKVPNPTPPDGFEMPS